MNFGTSPNPVPPAWTYGFTSSSARIPVRVPSRRLRPANHRIIIALPDENGGHGELEDELDDVDDRYDLHGLEVVVVVVDAVADR